MEYACPVFHDSLPVYLSNDLERIQKRAMRIIYPSTSYQEALTIAELVPFVVRRQQLTDKLFKQISNDKTHKLNKLLPSENSSTINLRNKRKFSIPNVKTNRFKNSFIISNSIKAFYSNNCSSRLITKVLITLSNVSVSYTETIFKDYDFN